MENPVEEVYVKQEVPNYYKIELEVEGIREDVGHNSDNVAKAEKDVSDTDDTEEDASNVKTVRSIEFEGKVYTNGKRLRLKCPQCEKTFKNRANLKGHLKNIHATEDEAVECHLCFRTFKSIVHLRSHTSSVHAEVNEVTCPHCAKQFQNKKKLSNHIFYTHPKPEENVICDVCSKVFQTKYRLKLHVRTVHPQGKNVNCPECQKEFKSDMLLQRHRKWAHPVDGMDYRCQECGRVLPSIPCYKKHLKNVHGLGNIECELCGKVFQTNNTLKRHLKVVHEGLKIETKEPKNSPAACKCTKCDKSFATKTALMWHDERLHSDNRVTTHCMLCSKEFGDHNGLKRHMETVHSIETATCHVCMKTFKSLLNLQRHVRVTHAPPEKAQTCDICHKTFKCSLHLKVHLYAVHPQKEKVSCAVCNKEFSSKKYLIKHSKTHNTKEFPCGNCDKIFKTTTDVKRHIKRVHYKHTGQDSEVFSYQSVLENDNPEPLEDTVNTADFIKVEMEERVAT